MFRKLMRGNERWFDKKHIFYEVLSKRSKLSAGQPSASWRSIYADTAFLTQCFFYVRTLITVLFLGFLS